MKIYDCQFKAISHTLFIRCIGKNKREALRDAKASFQGIGNNPNWLKMKMLKEVKPK